MKENSFLEGQKRVMITGGTEGIGRSIADIFLLSNSQVAICARTKEKIAQAKDVFPIAEVVDLSDLSQAESFSKKVVRDLGGIDFVILNAGVHGVPIGEESTEEKFKREAHAIRVNYEAPFVISQSLRDDLKKSKGVLVYMTSQHAKFDPSKVPESAKPYAISKRKLEEFFTKFAQDPENDGILVIGIDPGPVDTKLREEIRIKGSAELSAVAQRDKDNKVLKDPKLVGKIIYKIVTERADFNQGTGGYTKPIKSGDIVRIDEHYLQ